MIRVKDLTYRVGRFTLGPLDLKIPEKGFFVIVGPSGAGKSVFLELISGLRKPKRGKLFMNGSEITGLPPEEREISMVFQKSLLFPHMNVFENIAFGLKIRGFSEKEIKSRVSQIAELCGITHLLNRDVKGLSGGESQRVALARALAVNPKVLLLDEPLSALDRPAREELRRHLRQLQRELELTAIHVTHDFEEALNLADTLGILINGNFVQVGTPDQVVSHPASETVAKLVGFENIIYGTVENGGFKAGPLFIPLQSHRKFKNGSKAVAFLKAEHLRILGYPEINSRGVLIKVRVVDVWGWEPHKRALVKAGDVKLIVRVGAEFTAGPVRPGIETFVEIIPEKVVVRDLP